MEYSELLELLKENGGSEFLGKKELKELPIKAKEKNTSLNQVRKKNGWNLLFYKGFQPFLIKCTSIGITIGNSIYISMRISKGGFFVDYLIPKDYG